jgi:Glycosyltransferases involved in cell wall biogenesis
LQTRAHGCAESWKKIFKYRKLEVPDLPLVSILIPNYNHSRYLDECIQSALDQTYPNVEILLLDNQSADSSVSVAAKYASRGVRINRNIINILNRSYRVLAEQMASGEYLLLMGADDAIHPAFVEKAVDIMQRHPQVGYVHGERDFMDEQSNLIELDPFFNCSFVAPGRSVMPIYMVTTIAHPAQGIVRRSAFERIEGYQREVDHMNADKSLWFYLSAVSDYAYIRDKMCRIRVSTNNQTALTQQNFQHPVLCHMIINEFCRYAEQHGFEGVAARKEEALQRLAVDFLAYAGGMLANGNYEGAWSYLAYAKILWRGVTGQKRWQCLMGMWKSKKIDMEYIAHYDTMFAARKRNYEPPSGFVPIDMGALQ